MLCGVDRPPIRPIYEALTRGSGKRHYPGKTQERRTEQDLMRNEVRMAANALREARQDNKSGCALIVAPWVTGSVKG